MENEYLKLGEINERLILFFIRRTYNPKNADSNHIYECTRKFWRIAAERIQKDSNGNFIYPIALGIYNGEVKGVFKIETWDLARNINTTEPDYINYANRYVFDGKPIDNSIYIGKILLDKNGEVLKNLQNPVRYINNK